MVDAEGNQYSEKYYPQTHLYSNPFVKSGRKFIAKRRPLSMKCVLLFADMLIILENIYFHIMLDR